MNAAETKNNIQTRLPNVFDYTSARQFLLDTLAEKQRQRPGYSLRQWCLKMGLKSHTLLTLLLQGKRPLRVKHVQFLAKGLELNTQEKMYLQSLIQLDSAAGPEEKDLCRIWLSDLHPGGNFRTSELDEFSVIAHWVHMTILSMTRLKNFTGSPEEIRKRLGNKVSIHEVRSAVNRLNDMGLLKLNDNGKLEATFHRVVSKDDIANRGAREYHKQVMDLAKQAVEQQDVAAREFQAFALAIPADKLPLAKEMIRKFRSQFTNAIGAEVGTADDVYQTNIQFFRLTESPLEALSSVEDEGAMKNFGQQIVQEKEIGNA